MRSYTRYNLTSQQLLDAGAVLINGERAGLDLQVAEAQGPTRKYTNTPSTRGNTRHWVKTRLWVKLRPK